MNRVFRQIQLYTFLKYCNESSLEKTVLDCGAGGNFPPLALFAEQGYRTCGIEIDPKAMNMSQAYEKEHGMSLGIIKGDMREYLKGKESGRGI